MDVNLTKIHKNSGRKAMKIAEKSFHLADKQPKKALLMSKKLVRHTRQYIGA
jgi:hypothetical protein